MPIEQLDPKSTLASLAIQVPAASRVFHRHRLDFCCGGQRSLEAACRERGLDPLTILSELEAEASQPEDRDWGSAPLDELVAEILARFHEPLRAELPELLAMAKKVEAVHAAKEGCPKGLAAHLAQILQNVELHLQKEEQILFPMILAGKGAQAGGPVTVMEREHDEHGADLGLTRSLTTDLVPPAAACATWRALYLRLAQLERDLMDHIHLENNVLFPRALGR
jgi:regulator of cell morphogenesis and NO signaling